MKKMSVKREILVIMMIIVAVLLISSKVLATGTSGGPIQIPTVDATTNPTPDPNSTNTTQTNVIQTNTITPIAPTTNTTGSNYQNTTSLPQTGDASDYAIFLLIMVAILIAVYAYQKVKQYNIK